MKITILLPISLVFALPAFAQEGATKAPATQQPATESKPAKDDATTAKDPAIVAMDEFIKKNGPAKKEGNWKTSLTKPPKLTTFDKDAQYEWHMKTNKGNITLRLMPDVAPMHVSNIIYLSRLGFYDGLIFHRVIKGFMAQGGCPLGNGMGSPGYKFDGEVKARHDKAGILSTANAGPGTDGSQFFITFKKQEGLDAGYTVCGEVVEGMETVKAMDAVGNPGDGPPTEKLTLDQSWIVVKPKGAPKDAPKDAPKNPEPPKGPEPGKKGG